MDTKLLYAMLNASHNFSKIPQCRKCTFKLFADAACLDYASNEIECLTRLENGSFYLIACYVCYHALSELAIQFLNNCFIFSEHCYC